MRCFIIQFPLTLPLLTDTSFSILSGVPAASTQVSLIFFFLHPPEMCLTCAAFVGISHANILTYWFYGTSFRIPDSPIRPYAFHDDRIGCICPQLSFLNRLPENRSRRLFPCFSIFLHLSYCRTTPLLLSNFFILVVFSIDFSCASSD